MTEEIVKKTVTPIAQNIEQVLIGGDLSKLTVEQRLSYYKAVCDSVGLNPLTKPFDYLSLSGKLVLYAKRDATDQLRKIHGVSILDIDSKMVQDVYVVTARAEDKDKRVDTSTGAVNLAKLTGDALANALMKAETKAKRRVTLSICGLGLLDETEIETIPDAHPVSEPAAAQARGGTRKSAPASESVICAECRATDSHAPTCSYHPKNKAQSTPPATQAAPQGAVVYEMTVEKVETGKTKGNRPYGRVTCRDQNNTVTLVNVFHETPQKYMGLWVGKSCEMEITSKPSSTNPGQMLYTLDKILRAGNVRYVDNAPSQDAPDAADLGFPEPEE